MSITSWLGSIRETNYGNIYCIIPSRWFNEVLKFKEKKEISDDNILTINNKQFIEIIERNKVAYKLRKNISPSEIVLIIKEYMDKIIDTKGFHIDYVILVEYDAQSNTISLEKGVNIFKKANYSMFQFGMSQRSVPDVYSLGTSFLYSEKREKKNKVKESSELELSINKTSFIDKDTKEKSINLKNEKKIKSKNNLNVSNISGRKNIQEGEQSLSSNNGRGNCGQRTPSTDDKSKNSKSINQSQISSSSHENSPKQKEEIVITSLSNYKQLPLIPKGLSNPSVYCFMNTCLQCLSSIPELNQYFLIGKYVKEKKSKKPLQACTAYNEFLQKYKEKDSYFRPPKSIYSTCHSFLQPNQQHDCQEFLRRFLGAIQDELNKNQKYTFPDNITLEKAWKIYRDVNPSFIDSIFTGLMRSSVKCCKCGHPSYTYDPFLDLSVSINSKTKDYLDSCLDKYFSEEKINCEYKCEKCHKKTSIVKKLDIAILPPILTIQFKRFEESGWKITSSIKFDHILDLENYTCETSYSQGTKYSLIAVAVHSGGSISSGHYYAYVKRENQWYLCNDSDVTRCNGQRALSKDAYLLFYRQI